MSSDLVVLVPDKDIEQAVGGLLGRHQSIGIRSPVGVKFIVHPGRDPGVYNTGDALIEPFVGEARYALIIFDRAWDGAPSADPAVLAETVESRCHPAWADRARCICIEPEVENWVWSDSPHVPSALGWANREELRTWLHARGLWPSGAIKPPDPKAAFEAATRQKKVVPSSSIFGELAKKVGIQRCQDLSFLRLLGILREWFPQEARSTTGRGSPRK